MAGPKRSRRAFAMNEQPPLDAVNDVPLQLARIVRYVVEDVEPGFRQNLRKGLAGEMSDYLTVGEGAIDPGTHRTEILLAQVRINRSGGQLAVGKCQTKRWRTTAHLA